MAQTGHKERRAHSLRASAPPAWWRLLAAGPGPEAGRWRHDTRARGGLREGGRRRAEAAVRGAALLQLLGRAALMPICCPVGPPTASTKLNRQQCTRAGARRLPGRTPRLHRFERRARRPPPPPPHRPHPCYLQATPTRRSRRVFTASRLSPACANAPPEVSPPSRSALRGCWLGRRRAFASRTPTVCARAPRPLPRCPPRSYLRTPALRARSLRRRRSLRWRRCDRRAPHPHRWLRTLDTGARRHPQ